MNLQASSADVRAARSRQYIVAAVSAGLALLLSLLSPLLGVGVLTATILLTLLLRRRGHPEVMILAFVAGGLMTGLVAYLLLAVIASLTGDPGAASGGT